MNLKVIAFDADDTLFVNEPYFQETEQKFCALIFNKKNQHRFHKLPQINLCQFAKSVF